MAAGSVVVYEHALEDIGKGLVDLASVTVVIHLCSAGYTPSAISHSSWSVDISTHELTHAGYASKILANQTWTRDTNSTVRFDGDDTTISATVTMAAKYAVGVLQALNRPLFYYDLETGDASGLNATQIVNQWNASGIFRFNQTGL